MQYTKTYNINNNTKIKVLLLFNNLYYLINYSKTHYINNNTNIYKSLKIYETPGVSRFPEIYFVLTKNESFIYYFL